MTLRRITRRAACLLTGFVLLCVAGSELRVEAGRSSSATAASSSAQKSKTRRKVRRKARRTARRTTTPRNVPVVTGDRNIDARPASEASDDEPPPPARPAPRKREVISGGVLNGKAISKPQPDYPPIAKAARASGTVTVQIVVDESGQVISARAVSGHPLLRNAAEAAARQARFTPTRLSGQPVKVSGVITYNFVL